jgi:DNA-binding MarR family transcriptional regulator
MSTPPRVAADPALRLLDVFPAFERAFARWAQSRLGECGGVSSPARMRLLGVLHCKGPQIMSGLSDALGVTPRNVTTLVDALEGEGLVRRLAVPTDRRATLVELTPRGLERATEALAPFHEKLAEPFRDLSKKDQRELLRLMERLLDALHRRERGDGG